VRRVAWRFRNRNLHANIIAPWVIFRGPATIILAVGPNAIEHEALLRPAIDRRLAREQVFGKLGEILRH
jgi:hypothetical protein